MLRIRDLLILLVLVALGTGLGVWHQQLAAAGRQDPVAGVVRAIVIPVQGGARSASNAVVDFLYGVTHSRQLRNENTRLWARIQSMQSLNVRLRELETENARLRTMSHFPPPGEERWIATSVIGAYLDQGTITVACGSRQGIRPGAAVTSPRGVIGQVFRVDPTSAQVQLITAQDANVGARVERSRSVGICQGTAEDYLDLNYLGAGSDVREGDLVLTSGLSPTYPKGLVIGYVGRVWLDPVYNVRKATVKPAANLAQVEEVFVLR